MKKLLLGDSLINQFIQVVPITLLICFLYVIVRIIILKKKIVKIDYKQEILYLVFIGYIVGLFNLVLVPSNFWSGIWRFIFYGYSENLFDGMFEFSYNFVPILYKVITGKYVLGTWVMTMVIGNVLMFIPMGMLLPLCFKKINNKSIVIYAILIPLMIEFFQPIIGRSFDIDDLIMNFLGIIIGYLISKYFVKKKEWKK